MCTLLTHHTEEFNKYLSYVRNLGFEDTPDYDYLRDLFTQALKNTGELEDGEYDWMKLNGGKGWEAQRSSQRNDLHHPIANPPNSSARELVNAPNRASKVPQDRLNQELPKPGATRPPGQSRHQTPQGGTPRNPPSGFVGADLAKRKSGADMAAPEGSTTAHFQNSTQNLPTRVTQQSQQGQATTSSPNARQQDPPKSGFQKFLSAICCG